MRELKEVFQEQLKSIHDLAIEYKLVYGAPRFCAAPQLRKFFKISRWSWDYLPIYHFEFRFKVKENEQYRLCLIHVSDSGFYDKPENVNQDRVNLNKFLPPKNSESYLYVLYCHTDLPVIKRNELSVDNENSEHISNDENVYFGKRYPISELRNKETILRIRQDFSIQLKRINHLIFSE